MSISEIDESQPLKRNVKAKSAIEINFFIINPLDYLEEL